MFNLWQQTLGEKSLRDLSELLHVFVGAETNFFTVWWYLPIILEISNVTWFSVSSDVIKHFPEAVKSHLQHLIVRLWNYSLIIWNTEVLCQSCKWLQFVYACTEANSFYTACAYTCCHHSVKISLNFNF